MRIAPLALSLLLAFSAVPASADALKPFKDDLFAYPAELSSGDGGKYRVLDYRELRDINARDQVPERRVKATYVDTSVRSLQKDLVLNMDNGGAVRHVAVGKTAGASVIVLYLHGQGGSRKQGVDDFTFGGNFNRIKNLMAANGGLYLSPDFSDFGDKGAAEVAALIAHYAGQSPRAKIVVACGSMGGALCWKLAGRNDAGNRIGGLMLLGSLWDEGFFASPAFERQGAGILRAGQQGSGVSGREPGSLLPFHSCAVEKLPGALRALRNRHARYADPHDRLARDAELDTLGRALKITVACCSRVSFPD